jgi:hypothetical protein
MSSDLSSMERGELCHDRYMGSLLADCVQDIGAAKSNVRGAFVQAPYLSTWFSDCGIYICQGGMDIKPLYRSPMG